MADRRSSALQSFSAWIKKVSPAAWLLSIVFSIISIFFSGLEKLLLEVSKVAKDSGKNARVKNQTSPFLVWLAKFVRELAPWTKGLSLLTGFTAVIVEACKAACLQIQSRADTWEEGPDDDDQPATSK